MQPDAQSEIIARSVAEIIAAVKERGDAALIEFTQRWDKVALRPETLRVPVEKIQAAGLESEFARAFQKAAERIRKFHAEVKPRSITVEDAEGARLGIRWTPLQAVGLYIPGGKASYPSTLAMTAIPAQIAGVERIAVVSPPGPGGEVSPQVLLAAKVLGLDEIYRVGGAHAVAALAFGTASIPKVDKIFGPGNAFVAEAKKQLYGTVGIDLLAGPSEVVVYADHTARPEWVAADLMAQAEHDEATRATLLASSPAVLAAVQKAIAERIDQEPRREVIRKSFERNGAFLVATTPAEAARRINAIAPEHLSLQVSDPWGFLPLVRHAGAIFLGGDSPVAMGDYYAGPNHVLPTGGTARFASCLSVEDFMKRSNLCQTSAAFVREHGRNVETLAEGENLPAHRASIAARRAGEGKSGPRPGFDLVEAYRLVEEEGEVKLNQNESPWDVPEDIKDEILSAMRRASWNRYHQKLPDELRRSIARSAGLEPGRVFVGNGSNLVLQWIFEAFAGPGRKVLCPAPSFSLYRMWGRLCDAEVEEFRLVEGSGVIEYPAAEIARKIRELRPALTVLCLPNNPTGSEMPQRDLLAVLEAAEAAGGWVLVDEAYREFSEPEFDRTALARSGRRIFLLRTYSKALAAAGLRIGYLLAPAEAAEAMAKIVPPFHVSLFNAVAGKVIWDRWEVFQERLERLKRERQRLEAGLSRIPGVKPFRTWSNFFLVRVPDSEKLLQRLGQRGILVRRVEKDPLIASCLRINVGAPEENDRLLEAVRAIVAGE
ncbi:MAG: histidinol dehydrogenase [Planctomycetes bacterium]|nr:histidinol dehydrogenase [Planctomycetota bacterium]